MRPKTLLQGICLLPESVGIDGKRMSSTLHEGVSGRPADQDPDEKGQHQENHSDRPSAERCRRMLPMDLRVCPGERRVEGSVRTTKGRETGAGNVALQHRSCAERGLKEGTERTCD